MLYDLHTYRPTNPGLGQAVRDMGTCNSVIGQVQQLLNQAIESGALDSPGVPLRFPVPVDGVPNKDTIFALKRFKHLGKWGLGPDNLNDPATLFTMLHSRYRLKGQPFRCDPISLYSAPQPTAAPSADSDKKALAKAGKGKKPPNTGSSRGGTTEQPAGDDMMAKLTSPTALAVMGGIIVLIGAILLRKPSAPVASSPAKA